MHMCPQNLLPLQHCVFGCVPSVLPFFCAVCLMLAVKTQSDQSMTRCTMDVPEAMRRWPGRFKTSGCSSQWVDHTKYQLSVSHRRTSC